MESDLPKVLHQVVELSNINVKYPILVHVLNTSIKLNPTKIFVIVGKYKNIIEETIIVSLSEHQKIN